MDYERMWSELKCEIGSDIDFLVIKDPCRGPSAEDIVVINTLRRVEWLMKSIKKKHIKKEEKSAEENK